MDAIAAELAFILNVVDLFEESMERIADDREQIGRDLKDDYSAISDDRRPNRDEQVRHTHFGPRSAKSCIRTMPWRRGYTSRAAADGSKARRHGRRHAWAIEDGPAGAVILR